MVFELKTLRQLFIGGNKFTSIPEEIGKLQGLESIRAGMNCLTGLPAALSSLPLLNFFSAESNGLVDVDWGQGLFPELEYIDLSKNKIREFPPKSASKGCFPKIHKLYLYANQIEQWNDGIMSPDSLQVLEISQNRLASADFATQFPLLKAMEFSTCKIK